mgnify:CR=1 FL=1
MVYGGSWGSTLSLAYAFVHPKRTSELVLRGIYFCTDDEVHWLSEGKGAGFIRPDGWDYFMNCIVCCWPIWTIMLDPLRACQKNCKNSYRKF